MEAYILAVQLMRNGPVIQMPVTDCKVGVVWIHEAWRWAERAGVSETEPMYVCYPERLRLNLEVAKR